MDVLVDHVESVVLFPPPQFSMFPFSPLCLSVVGCGSSLWIDDDFVADEFENDWCELKKKKKKKPTRD